MLIYGSNIAVTKALPPLQKAQEINYDNWLTRIIFTAGRIISQVLIYKVSKLIETSLIAINPALGLVAGAAFLYISSIMTDFAWDKAQGNEIDGNNIRMNLLLNSLPFVYKGAKLATRIAKNKVFRLATNLKDKSLAAQLRKTAYATQKIGLDKKQYVKNDRAFVKAEAILKNANVAQLGKDSFKKTIKQANELRKKIMPIIKAARKSIFITRQVTSALVSPEYAAKKGLDLLTRIPKKKIVKGMNIKIKALESKWKLYLKQKFRRIGFLFDDSYLKDVYLKSKWLERIRFFPSKNVYAYASMTFTVYFKQAATIGKNGKGKLPQLITNKDTDKVLKFLTVNSPGRHYIDNFSYGWEIGKFLRKHKKLIIVSNIPLYSNIINNIFWSVRTFMAIKKSLTEKSFEWNENVGQKILKGFKDNALKGWNVKYAAPVIHIARSKATKQKRYLFQTVMKQTNKQTKLFKTRLKIRKRRR